jgi:hypothetical protein
MHSASTSEGRKPGRFRWVRVGLIIALVVSVLFGLFTRPATSAAGTPIRVNAGGGSLNVGGTTWDRCYGVNDCFSRVSSGYMTWPSSAPVVTGAVAPANQTLYQSYWSAAEPSFTFAITVPNGPALVRLHFAEPDKTAPYKRVFDVRLEGVTVLDNLDIFVAAGGAGQDRPLQARVRRPAGGRDSAG